MLASRYDRARMVVMSSFFFEKLVRSEREKSDGDGGLQPYELGHALVACYTRCVDIFAKDYIFIPINADKHWSLAVISGLRQLDAALRAADSKIRTDMGRLAAPAIDREQLQDNIAASPPAAASAAPAAAAAAAAAAAPQSSMSGGMGVPCILFMDSLGIHDRPRSCDELRAWLLREWEVRRNGGQRVGGGAAADPPALRLMGGGGSTITQAGGPRLHMLRDVVPAAPQQDNGYDCGLFILKYAETIMGLAQRGGVLEHGLNELMIDDALDGIIGGVAAAHDDSSEGVGRDGSQAALTLASFCSRDIDTLRETMRRTCLQLVASEASLVAAASSGDWASADDFLLRFSVPFEAGAGDPTDTRTNGEFARLVQGAEADTACWLSVSRWRRDAAAAARGPR